MIYEHSRADPISLNPATEKIFATFDYSSPAEVEEVLTAASDAFRQWRTRARHAKTITT